MVARDDLVFCPAVYCYATYAEADQRRPLRFHDFPGPTGRRLDDRRHRPRHLGTMQAIARRPSTYAALRGEPPRSAPSPSIMASRRAGESGMDEAINARFGGCYRDTLATMEGCWIRPRYNGYLAFQAKAGELIGRICAAMSAKTRCCRNSSACTPGVDGRDRSAEPARQFLGSIHDSLDQVVAVGLRQPLLGRDDAESAATQRPDASMTGAATQPACSLVSLSSVA